MDAKKVIKRVLNEHPSVAAAYLFGSYLHDPEHARDIDILVLLSKSASKDSAYFDIIAALAGELGISTK